MKKPLEAVAIDPESRTLKTIRIEAEKNDEDEFDYELADLRQQFPKKCWLERVPVFGNYDMWVDEEGLLKPNKYFCLGMQFTPYAGFSLLLPRKEPLINNPAETLESLLVWIDAEPSEQKVASPRPGHVHIYNDWTLKSPVEKMEAKVLMQGRLHALPIHIMLYFARLNSPDEFTERFAGGRAVARNGEIVLYDRTPWWRPDKNELQVALSKEMSFEMADAMTSIRSVQ